MDTSAPGNAVVRIAGYDLLVVMPSYMDLSSACRLMSEIRATAPIGVRVCGLVIDESLGRDSGWNSSSADDLRITLPYRMGAQSALSAALAGVLPNVDSPWICTMDSDGEDCAEDVWRLWAARSPDIDMVLAIRGKRQGSTLFIIGYRGFRALYRGLTGQSISSGNFALIGRNWLESNISRPEFQLTYAGAIASVRCQRIGIRCDRGSRDGGRSRMRTTDSVSDALRWLLPQSGRIAARTLLALIFTAALGIIGLLWIFAFNVQGTASPGWTTSALLLIGGGFGLVLVLFLISSVMNGLLLLGKPHVRPMEISIIP